MMKRKFHLTVLCAILLSTSLPAQNWFADESFLNYYSDNEQIFLVPDLQRVDIYLKSEPTNGPIHLAKAKGFVGWSKAKNMMSIDFSDYQDVNISNLTPPQLAKILEIPYEDIHEVVPSVKVNGRIKATLKNDFIFKLNSSVEPKYLESLFERLGAEIKTQKPDGSIIVSLKKVKNGFDLIHELAALQLIEYAQPDMEVKIEHTSDPLFAKQYQIQNNGGYIDGLQTVKGIDLNVVPAWDITKGSGVTIAVLDDGLEAHEDLPNITGGFTPADGGNGAPTATGKHGMAVAGIISGQHNNVGVKGISPNSKLLGVNIFAQGTTLSDYAEAFYWAVDNGADIINNSWGFIFEDLDIESVNPPIYTVRKGAMCSNNPFPALTSAINFAADHGRNGKGCIITFASGNWAQEGPLGQNSDECVTYPGSLEKVIAIGAVNPKGVKTIYSDYGPKLDFVAPSNDLNSSGSRSYYGVRTIDREGARGYSRSNYHSGFGGTSAATPAASGAIALVLSANQELTRQELTSLLINTAKDVEEAGFDTRTGHGLIDAYAAISHSGDQLPVDPCAHIGGDDDSDGICNADDCQPNNASYPSTPGSSCNDGDPSTENDRVTSDGCGCQGTSIACYDAGGDADGDGYCFEDDCDDTDPFLPGKPGDYCDDGDSSTSNDRVTADGCGCQGQTIPCFDEGGDLDGDGFCFLDDCDDENPLVPAIPGTACDDRNSNTENDLIQSDGCTCKGTLIDNDENNNDDDNDTDNTETEEDPEEEAACVNPENLAAGGKASLSSTFFTFGASRAIDGDKSSSRYAQTNYSRDPYFDLDLTNSAEIKQINILLKATPKSTIQVFVSDNSFDSQTLDDLMNDASVTKLEINEADNVIPVEVIGRYIRLQTGGFQSLAIIEIEVMGCEINTQASATDFDFEEKSNELDSPLAMMAFPNPTNNDAFVAFENGVGKSGALFVHNSLGQVVFHQHMDKIPLIPVHLDMDGLENGMYIIEVVTDNQRLTEKLILSR